MRLFAVLIMLAIWTAAPAQGGDVWPSISEAQWAAYKQRFLDPSGRIVDGVNGNISHSEGQGYGLLLAYLAGNRPDFDLIWSFTRTELLLRDDGLAAWKWDPNASPHVSDVNNATDGDVLIAYALAKAGRAWQAPELTAASTAMIQAIGTAAIDRHQGMSLILPAAHGFSAADRPDGPVVNLSYWIFEALPLFAELDPRAGWPAVNESGLRLLAMASDGLPPDWLSLRAGPKPARGFPSEFGYNAVRIPLYLVRAEIDRADLLEPYAGDLAVTDVETGAVRQPLSDPGYRIVAALAACAVRGTPVPVDLRTFEPTTYYPSTLHLLALSRLSEHREACR